MHVFVSGASGFIGQRVVTELLGAGHRVTGLARSDDSAAIVTGLGADVLRGDLTDLDALKAGARAADAVIHLAFIHDFAKFAENGQIDKRAIEAMGEVLAGTGKPLIATGGLAEIGTPGSLPTEDMPIRDHAGLPRVSEQTTLGLVDKGVSAAVMRLPQVHDTTRQGLVTYLIAMARQKGVSAYIGGRSNRWAAVHVDDAARAYRLALEHHRPGLRHHAIAEEGIRLETIAKAVGTGLGLPVRGLTPEQAAEHFGPFAGLVGFDLIGSSAITQKRLGWSPKGPGLIEDLAQMDYSLTRG